MTVSHLYYGSKIVEASTNYEIYLKDKNQKIDYDLEDPDFK